MLEVTISLKYIFSVSPRYLPPIEIIRKGSVGKASETRFATPH